ncbi:hypothetical protein EV131_113118 [Rhizobium laguerreae]|uniref:Uncharacterized protein n=1 Tax=Rhizobium laguerreae TaxID=1076926 RepID=A0AAX2QEZ3_9HYPH|nr:hypothetical protein EV131_113118 [Rhizobium laguerreae]
MAAIQNAWGASGRLAMPDHQALLLVGNLKLYFRKASPRTFLRPVVGLANALVKLEW